MKRSWMLSPVAVETVPTAVFIVMKWMLHMTVAPGEEDEPPTTWVKDGMIATPLVSLQGQRIDSLANSSSN
jgi:hypothetical protein